MPPEHVWLQGDDFEWVTTPERILRVALLFLILISISTYTANLVAFLTEDQWTVYGPKVSAIHSDTLQAKKP